MAKLNYLVIGLNLNISVYDMYKVFKAADFDLPKISTNAKSVQILNW